MIPRKLIINADDFGLTEEINHAIIRVFENGSLTSATLMANMPATEHAASLSTRFPTLGIGLHYNLTEGRPVSTDQNKMANKLVCSDGDFLTRRQLFTHLFLGKVTPNDLRMELQAQFERIQALGIHPTHIDSHQHIHLHPTVFRIIRDFSMEKKLAVRIPHPQLLSTGGLNHSFLKRLKKRITANAVNRMDTLRLPTNESLNSIHDLVPFERPTIEHYQRLILEAESKIHEIMVHPFAESESLRALYSNPKKNRNKHVFLEKCYSEYKILCSFSVRDWILSRGLDIQLCTFQNII